MHDWWGDACSAAKRDRGASIRKRHIDSRNTTRSLTPPILFHPFPPPIGGKQATRTNRWCRDCCSRCCCEHFSSGQITTARSPGGYSSFCCPSQAASSLYYSAPPVTKYDLSWDRWRSSQNAHTHGPPAAETRALPADDDRGSTTDTTPAYLPHPHLYSF